MNIDPIYRAAEQAEEEVAEIRARLPTGVALRCPDELPSRLATLLEGRIEGRGDIVTNAYLTVASTSAGVDLAVLRPGAESGGQGDYAPSDTLWIIRVSDERVGLRFHPQF